MDDHVPRCHCELVSVCLSSPGPIETQEKLVSAITNPKYVDPKTGKVLPTISDRLGNGLSADRVKYTNATSFNQRVQDLVRNDPKKIKVYRGVIMFSVQKLRNVFDNGKRCFAVYDTATQKNPSHSEVVQTNHPNDHNLTRSMRSVKRAEIRELLPKAMDFEGKMVSSKDVFPK